MGHTADDQAETVLMNLVRGAGLVGLAGMAESRPLARKREEDAQPLAPEADIVLVRPLLGFTRAEIEAEARARSWAWREDASNASGAYRRNRIRHGALALLEQEGGPGTVLRIAASAQAARRASGSAAARLARVGEATARGGTVPLAALRVLHREEQSALLAEMMRTYAPEAPRSRALIAQVAALLDAPPGARVEAGPVDVWRDRQRLTVARRRAPWPGCAVASGDTPTPFGTLTLTPLADVPSTHSTDPTCEIVDAAVCTPEAAASRIPLSLHPSIPLTLRLWREGDRIRPLGMGGTKLVSDVLADARVPPSERRQRLVLVAGETVLWVVGIRLAHHARVTPATTRAIALEWRPIG